MKAAVIVFPGSNCDRDMCVALEQSMGAKPVRVWHGDSELPDVDLIAVPGGFSYGDYLRSGAMAAHSPIMREVKKAAEKGKYVLGVCNGFQVLTETGLLPGALMRNKNLKFICKPVTLKAQNKKTPFTQGYSDVITIPVAHHDGNYFADDATIKTLEDEDSIAFQYVNAGGNATEESNPNGSLNNIAGIFNKKKNVLGMMPHPERYVDALNGGTDGKTMFDTLVSSLG